MPTPVSWDVSRYRGDAVYGSFRVTNGLRTVVEVSWQPVRQRFDANVHAKKVAPELEPADEALQSLVNHLPDGARLFHAADTDVFDLAAVWHDAKRNVAAIVRLFIDDDDPDEQAAAEILSGIVTPSADETLNWAAFDFRLQLPQGFVLQDASLAAGVCHLTFRQRRQRLTFRRFSAVSTVLPSHSVDDFDRWLRLVYAAAFHDMRYVRDGTVERDEGMTLRYLATRSAYGAIEWRGLFPQFRSNPCELVVQYVEQGNCVHCFERNSAVTDETFETMIRSARRQETPGNLDGAVRQVDVFAARVHRRDEAFVERTDAGLVRLRYMVRRPGGLRIVRMLAGQPTDGTQTRTAELDAVGSLIWDACAAPVTMAALIETVMRRLTITAREATLTVTQHVRNLASRRLLTLDHGVA